MTSLVSVSGFQNNFTSFKAPSGQWGVNLDASLVSMNATFGFNETAHRFNLQFVTEEFNGGSGNLPPIDTYTRFEITPNACDQGFFIAGKIVHADYSNSTNGTTVAIEVEDRRKCILDQVKITSEDLGENIPSGLVSIGAYYRNAIGFKDAGGAISDSRVKEYRNILELGATYEQIYNALIWASGLNQSNVDTTKLPSPAVISANLLGSTEPLRWKLTSTALSTVISTVCSDASYDWYWGMRDDEVKLVNRKVEFVVDENSLPIQVLSPDSVDFKFGADRVQAPGQITVLGAHQEGFLNSRLLSPIDGIDEPSSSFTFTPAWSEISVSFYDAFGVYRTYKPSDTELQMALMGIDWWTHYKKFQVSEYGDAEDEGSVAAQHPTFQSRLDPGMPVSDFFNNSVSGVRIITSRYGDDHIWTLEWFSRVANHANNHFGKTYKLEGFAFDEDDGFFQPIEAAWCNLENQKSADQVLFEENYSIDPLYLAVSPFVTQDFKVRAHAVMPSSTIYGADGLNAPASFTDWNEDAHPSGDQTYEHYIPIDIKRVGQKVINPRDEQNAFEDYPEGTIIAQFPILVASGRNQNGILADLVTLHELGVLAASSGVEDIIDPTTLVEPYQEISGVAIPVQIRNRYGQVYPAPWSSGSASGVRHEMIIDDRFSPWNYFAKNTNTSVDIMSQRVSGFIEAKLINVNESRFAELNKVDWPFVGFDGYSNQSFISGVYGRREHGVTDISVSYTQGVPRTTYGIKSFFTDFVKDAPLGERNFADLNNIIHPIDFQELQNNPIRPSPDFRTIGDGADRPFGIPGQSIRKQTYAVTITQVFNRGSTTEPERYFSITKDNVPKPGGAIDPLDDNDLICRDGFLNVGDPALYIVEYKSNGQRRRYYTNGTDLTQGGHLAEVSSVDAGAGTVDISYRGFNLNDLAPLGKEIGNITVGEKGTIVTDGTMKADNDGGINGLRPDRSVPNGVFFQVVSGEATATSGAAIPVIINAISDFATCSGEATVQPIIPSGTDGCSFAGSGASTGNVRMIPIPEFAQSGDIGVFTENSAGDKFIFINRQSFSAFN